jgi:uncharacterized membrane protein
MGSKLLVSAALNGLGFCVSVFLTLQHYGLVGSSALCELGSSLSCSAVLGSSYAVLLGVPVAVLGVVYFVLATACSLLVLTANGDFRSKRDAAVANVAVTGAGVLSVVYFVVAEMLVGSLCPLCTVVHVIVISTFVMALQHQRSQGPFLWSFGSFAEIASQRSAWVGLVLLIVLIPLVAFNLPLKRESPLAEVEVAAIASCLSARRATMYGSTSCSHCIAQKGLFGEHFAKVPFVDCEASSDTCKTAGVKGYPTWILSVGGTQQRREGLVPLKDLAKWTGCLVEASSAV